MDTITVRGLRVFAYHGVGEEEQRKGQPFVLDLTLYADLSRPGASDDLDDTVNYAAAVKCATRAMLAQKDRLIERAATRVADALLAAFPRLDGVTVCLHKPRAPIAADFDDVAVTLTRRRGGEG